MSIHKSSTLEQMQAEEHIFALTEQKLGFSLKKNPKIYLSDSVYSYIQPDFFSEEEKVIGEIFAHIGKPKVGQKHKIANDILKMLLFEEKQSEKYRKMIVVCDMEMYQYLHGESFLAESIRCFEVTVVYIEVDEKTQRDIALAQKRQKMVNS